MKPKYRFVGRLPGMPDRAGIYVFELANRDEALKIPWAYDRELRYVNVFWAAS